MPEGLLLVRSKKNGILQSRRLPLLKMKLDIPGTLHPVLREIQPCSQEFNIFPSNQVNEHSHNKSLFLTGMILSMTCWGLSWTSAKIIASYGSPITLTFLRFSFTFLSMIIVLTVLRQPFTIKRKGIGNLLAASLCISLYTLLFFKKNEPWSVEREKKIETWWTQTIHPLIKSEIEVCSIHHSLIVMRNIIEHRVDGYNAFLVGFNSLCIAPSVQAESCFCEESAAKPDDEGGLCFYFLHKIIAKNWRTLSYARGLMFSSLHHLAKIVGLNFILCLPVRAYVHGIVRDKNLRLDGLEPSTPSLKVRCSTNWAKVSYQNWPQGDSNPCYQNENLVS